MCGNGTYTWSGDEVVLESSQEIEGADYEATNGDEVVTGTTPDTQELAEETWTATYGYESYLGEATADLAETNDLSATLCMDLSGDWICTYDGYDDGYDTQNAAMDGCRIQINGVTGYGSDWISVAGNRVEFDLGEGFFGYGLAEGDTIIWVCHGQSDGHKVNAGMTCLRE